MPDLRAKFHTSLEIYTLLLLKYLQWPLGWAQIPSIFDISFHLEAETFVVFLKSALIKMLFIDSNKFTSVLDRSSQNQSILNGWTMKRQDLRFELKKI